MAAIQKWIVEIWNALPGAVAIGLIYGIMAIGVYITFRILDIADLTVDGSFVTGGAVCAMMLAAGNDVYVSLLCAFAVGMLTGLVTGLFHTLLGIPAILSGILTQLMLWTVNLKIMGSRANVAINTRKVAVLVTRYRVNESIGNLCAVAFILIIVLYWFFGTEKGSSIRATGCNINMSRAQGINTNVNKVIALMLSNGIVALAGALFAQNSGASDINNGRGAIVIGLAAIIIGEGLLSRFVKNFAMKLLSVVLGGVAYYIIYTIVINLGMDTDYLKMLIALLVAMFLGVPYLKKTYLSGLIKKLEPSITKLKAFIGRMFRWLPPVTQKVIKVIKVILRPFAMLNAVLRKLEAWIGKLLAPVAHWISQLARRMFRPVARMISALRAKLMRRKPVEQEKSVKIRNLTKIFNAGTINEKVALEKLDLTLQNGDFVTVIGGNGAGKSTLLNAISGVWGLDSGDIIVDGTNVSRIPEYKRAKFLGRVFQDPMMGTAADMEIQENLAIARRRGKFHGFRWGITRKEKAEYVTLLKQLDLGLENRLSVKMGLLSGGQRQAVTLLMASLNKPKILLLDEHTAALDPKTAEKVLRITDRIVNENKLTTIMVTHNMADALKYGNRLIMMNQGKIIVDVKDEEKAKLTVKDLLELFNKASGMEFVNDRALLNN